MISRSHGLSVLSITTSNQTKYFPKTKDKPFSSHLSCRSLIGSLDLELTACRAPWLTGTHNPSHTCSGNSEEGQPQTPLASGYRPAYLSVPSDLALEKTLHTVHTVLKDPSEMQLINALFQGPHLQPCALLTRRANQAESYILLQSHLIKMCNYWYK